MPIKYDIWMKGYPQPDTNIMDEWDFNNGEPLKKSEAESWINELESNYADESWRGHRLFMAKFYMMECRVSN